VQNSSLHYRAHFDVALWEPIFDLQSRSQCINKTSMLWFHSSVYFEDKVFMRQTVYRDTVFHGTLRRRARTTSVKPPLGAGHFTC
jgi:hypothetical protein